MADDEGSAGEPGLIQPGGSGRGDGAGSGDSAGSGDGAAGTAAVAGKAGAAMSWSPPVTMLDALETLAFALVSLTNRALSESGSDLTFQQWRAIVVLGAVAEPLRVSDIARAISASGPSASRIIRRLEEHGLVESRPDRRDGRVVRVRLTKAGAAVRAAVVARRRELIAELIGDAADRSMSPETVRIIARLATAI